MRSNDKRTKVSAPSDAAFQVDLEGVTGRLRIVSAVEPGHGVVPILDDGCALLRRGEVAVYREDRPHEIVPGLYCLERQRPVACSPHSDSPRIVEREVVFVRNHSRVMDAWEYHRLQSRIIRGVRRYVQPEGPIKAEFLGDLLLGPVIGIYMPGGCIGVERHEAS